MEHLLSSFMVTSFSTGWAGRSGSMALKKDDSTLTVFESHVANIKPKWTKALRRWTKCMAMQMKLFQ
jgi:hypothetical protein